MDMQELDISITPQGEVQIQVKGVAGTRCLDLTKGLEDSLGTVADRQFTSAYYEQQTLENHQWNQEGA
jgi:hypothetical protein